MTETTEEDVGFPGSTFGFILERQQMAGQASAVQRFQREFSFPFCSPLMGTNLKIIVVTMTRGYEEATVRRIKGYRWPWVGSYRFICSKMKAVSTILNVGEIRMILKYFEIFSPTSFYLWFLKFFRDVRINIIALIYLKIDCLEQIVVRCDQRHSNDTVDGLYKKQRKVEQKDHLLPFPLPDRENRRFTAKCK